MEVTKKSRIQYRIQAVSFLVLFLVVIGLLAWASHTYNFEADWTANKRNTLSEASIKLLQRMQDQIVISAFVSESGLNAQRNHIEELIKRYQKTKSDILLTFVNPDTEPNKVRNLGIKVDGELIIEYNRRSERVQSLSEQTLTNALQRLMRSGERQIVFVTGHGERKPQGTGNYDLRTFTKHLDKTGIKTSTLNLVEQPTIPENTAALVIAGPRVAYLPGETKLIRDYIRQGGNLLWLHDPGDLFGLELLADDLGIRFQPGVIVDLTTQLLGISDPSFAVVTAYPSHPINSDFNFMTIYPQASGIEHTSKENWTGEPFLQTVQNSWSEMDELQGTINFDKGKDIRGPLTIGIAMTRAVNSDDNNEPNKENNHSAQTQRVIVLGDGDFLANAYLGNQGNLDMGNNIVNWLSHDDTFINIPAKVAPDTQLTFNETTWSFIGLFFLLVLPVMLLGTGVTIWLQRRKR